MAFQHNLASLFPLCLLLTCLILMSCSVHESRYLLDIPFVRNGIPALMKLKTPDIKYTGGLGKLPGAGLGKLPGIGMLKAGQQAVAKMPGEGTGMLKAGKPKLMALKGPRTAFIQRFPKASAGPGKLTEAGLQKLTRAERQTLRGIGMSEVGQQAGLPKLPAAGLPNLPGSGAHIPSGAFIFLLPLLLFQLALGHAC